MKEDKVYYTLCESTWIRHVDVSDKVALAMAIGWIIKKYYKEHCQEGISSIELENSKYNGKKMFKVLVDKEKEDMGCSGGFL